MTEPTEFLSSKEAARARNAEGLAAEALKMAEEAKEAAAKLEEIKMSFRRKGEEFTKTTTRRSDKDQSVSEHKHEQVLQETENEDESPKNYPSLNAAPTDEMTADPQKTEEQEASTEKESPPTETDPSATEDQKAFAALNESKTVDNRVNEKVIEDEDPAVEEEMLLATAPKVAAEDGAEETITKTETFDTAVEDMGDVIKENKDPVADETSEVPEDLQSEADEAMESAIEATKEEEIDAMVSGKAEDAIKTSINDGHETEDAKVSETDDASKAVGVAEPGTELADKAAAKEPEARDVTHSAEEVGYATTTKTADDVKVDESEADSKGVVDEIVEDTNKEEQQHGLTPLEESDRVAEITTNTADTPVDREEEVGNDVSPATATEDVIQSNTDKESEAKEEPDVEEPSAVDASVASKKSTETPTGDVLPPTDDTKDEEDGENGEVQNASKEDADVGEQVVVADVHGPAVVAAKGEAKIETHGEGDGENQKDTSTNEGNGERTTAILDNDNVEKTADEEEQAQEVTVVAAVEAAIGAKEQTGKLKPENDLEEEQSREVDDVAVAKAGVKENETEAAQRDTVVTITDEKDNAENVDVEQTVDASDHETVKAAKNTTGDITNNTIQENDEDLTKEVKEDTVVEPSHRKQEHSTAQQNESEEGPLNKTTPQEASEVVAETAAATGKELNASGDIGTAVSSDVGDKESNVITTGLLTTEQDTTGEAPKDETAPSITSPADEPQRSTTNNDISIEAEKDKTTADAGAKDKMNPASENAPPRTVDSSLNQEKDTSDEAKLIEETDMDETKNEAGQFASRAIETKVDVEAQKNASLCDCLGSSTQEGVPEAAAEAKAQQIASTTCECVIL